MLVQRLVERASTDEHSFATPPRPSGHGSSSLRSAAGIGFVVILVSILTVASHAQTFSVLYDFSNSTTGEDPTGLVISSSGTFYGTTGAGGSNLGGTLWELTSGGTFSVLHAFSNSTDGEDPKSLIMDTSGNFYGTTGSGGANLGGTLWKRTSGGTFSVLHSFSNSSDGEDPGGLHMDSSGNFYGTTGAGGARRQLRGNVVEIDFKWHIQRSPCFL